jgi:UDP-N-acetylglucosamine--N-acetylmuramyl-(pentapeptide) pyrophosphoryl-undecaprenol N-acetylglucosamine transferase
LALVPYLYEAGFQIAYIGSHHGIERKLVKEANLPFYGVSSGKLRRYFSWDNFIDPLRVIKGIWQAFWLLADLRPQVVFSKGGFVTVPVIIAAWLLRIPAVIHESDYSPGLANKLSMPLAHKILTTFPETRKYLKSSWGRFLCTGLPIRRELFAGDPERGRRICGFNNEKPVLLVMGGSTGSKVINGAIRHILPELTEMFDVVHLCGQHQARLSEDNQNYRQFEYLSDELPDVFALADLVVSRSGANSIFELLALQKPHLLIPLSKAASRGDQILNANSFSNKGYSMVLAEEELNPDSLLDHIKTLYATREQYIAAMSQSNALNGTAQIVTELKKVAQKIR